MSSFRLGLGSWAGSFICTDVWLCVIVSGPWSIGAPDCHLWVWKAGSELCCIADWQKSQISNLADLKINPYSQHPIVNWSKVALNTLWALRNHGMHYYQDKDVISPSASPAAACSCLQRALFTRAQIEEQAMHSTGHFYLRYIHVFIFVSVHQ